MSSPCIKFARWSSAWRDRFGRWRPWWSSQKVDLGPPSASSGSRLQIASPQRDARLAPMYNGACLPDLFSPLLSGHVSDGCTLLRMENNYQKSPQKPPWPADWQSLALVTAGPPNNPKSVEATYFSRNLACPPPLSGGGPHLLVEFPKSNFLDHLTIAGTFHWKP